MKTIQSAGGPLIGLDREHLQRWSGVIGKNFLSKDTCFTTDYEAAGSLTNSKDAPPCAVALLNGERNFGILISMPFETAVIEISGQSTYIAQVKYSNADWRFDEKLFEYFRKADFLLKDSVNFSCQMGIYVLFDAAYASQNVGDDFLQFRMDAGNHVLSAAEYTPDGDTGLILYKIQKA